MLSHHRIEFAAVCTRNHRPSKSWLEQALAVVICTTTLATSHPAMAADGPANERILRNIEYASIDGHRLLLDLYLPDRVHRPRLLVWIHGGAWRAGSKNEMPLGALVTQGYAVASLDYRLSTVAKFPALIHDCKAAIRFLRAKQEVYGFDASRIGVLGSSAGGHLAALVGTSNGVRELEGQVGEHLDQSSSVQATVDYYGPTDFLTILSQSTPHGLNVRVPALQLLLGAQPEQVPELARLASPVFHVDASDPAILIVHGDRDPQVPINQSHELHGRFKDLQVPVEFEVIHGAAHGGAVFFDDQRMQLVMAFLRRHLDHAD